MGKRIFWGLIYLIAAGLTALTVWLYVIPEREIYVAEQTELTPDEVQVPWIDMPAFEVNGVPVTVGETRMKALIDGGLKLRFYQEGRLLDLDLEKSVTEPRMQYSLKLYDGEDYLADLKYTNATEGLLPVEACTVDHLDFHVEEMKDGRIPEGIRMEGKVIGSMKLSEVPEAFPGFVRENARTPRYLFTAMTAKQSMVAYFTATGSDAEKITGFGARNYVPGSSR